ncbi:MAG: hypothetical protein AAGJ10_15030 [Bacteroidota bacterium]
MPSTAPHTSRPASRRAPASYNSFVPVTSNPTRWVAWPQADTLYTSPAEERRHKNQPTKGFTLALFFCFWLVISSFFLLLYAHRYLL